MLLFLPSPEWAVRVFAAVAAAYSLLVFILWAAQNRLVFPAPGGSLQAVLGTQAGEVTALPVRHMTLSGGRVLDFFAIAPRPGMPIVIDFHGNGCRADDTVSYMAFVTRGGYGLIAAEYSGYSRNPGHPSERAFLADAHAYADWAAANFGGGPPILFGESMGTAVAIDLALEREVLAIVLDCPFTSFPAVMKASSRCRYIPAYLLRHRFDSLSKAPRVSAPVLVLSGTRDAIVPPSQAHALHDALHDGRGVLDFAGLPHLVLANDRSGRAQAEVLAFLASCRPEVGLATEYPCGG